jgi:hypothetical protein
MARPTQTAGQPFICYARTCRTKLKLERAPIDPLVCGRPLRSAVAVLLRLIHNTSAEMDPF